MRSLEHDPNCRGPDIHPPGPCPKHRPWQPPTESEQQELIRATGHCSACKARRYVHCVKFPNGVSMWVCIRCGSGKVSMIADAETIFSYRDYPQEVLDWSVCHYCGIVLGQENLTRDHIIPRAHGGRNHLINIQPCCRHCNERKADNWPTCTCSRCQWAILVHNRGL